VTTFCGCTGSMLCLSMAPNGRYLASGGNDGLKIWDLKSRKSVAIPAQPFHECRQVTYICWVTQKGETYDTLCYSNGLGFLVFLQ
ncbi:hypothetical protein L208DRAFT_1209810, partial [Tricholoma matsutake]